MVSQVESTSMFLSSRCRNSSFLRVHVVFTFYFRAASRAAEKQTFSETLDTLDIPIFAYSSGFLYTVFMHGFGQWSQKVRTVRPWNVMGGGALIRC